MKWHAMKRPAPARAAAKAKGKTTTKGIGNDKGRGNDKGKAKGNVVPFTKEENEMIIKLSWQGWDWLVDKMARASSDELIGFVSEPDEMIKNRANIAVVAHDGVPVYLDLSVGRLMRKPDDGPNQDDIILTWCPSS